MTVIIYDNGTFWADTQISDLDVNNNIVRTRKISKIFEISENHAVSGAGTFRVVEAFARNLVWNLGKWRFMFLPVDGKVIGTDQTSVLEYKDGTVRVQIMTMKFFVGHLKIYRVKADRTYIRDCRIVVGSGAPKATEYLDQGFDPEDTIFLTSLTDRFTNADIQKVEMAP
ncbi:MAG: hypothetical protein WCY93_08690 [Anaerolineaceae bacterium]